MRFIGVQACGTREDSRHDAAWRRTPDRVCIEDEREEDDDTIVRGPTVSRRKEAASLRVRANVSWAVALPAQEEGACGLGQRKGRDRAGLGCGLWPS